MSENQFHYGADFTSVRTHAAPGGNSSIQLGWEEEPKAPQRRPEEVKAEDPEEEEKEAEEEKPQEAAQRGTAGERIESTAATSVKVH